jgi:DNA-binding NarL/FixJ family response regulator
MARDLNLSVGTVKWHAKSIYRKAGIEGGASGKLMLLLRKFGKFEISVKWVPNRV